MARIRLHRFRNLALLAKALVVAALAVIGALERDLAAAAIPVSPFAPAKAGRLIARAGIPFVENAGQFDASVRFVASTFAGAVVVTDNGELQYVLMGLGGTANGTTPSLAPVSSHRAPAVAVLRETFVNGRAQPYAGVPSAGRVSRDIGDEALRDVVASRAYENVTFGEVFPGVDVRLHATGSNVEKIFTVAAHQDPGRIQLAIGGAERLSVSADGRLVVQLPGGEVSFTRPVACQIIDNRRVAVAAAYALADRGARYGFAVGDYDHGRPLVIDPLLATSSLGGSGMDTITAIAAHPSTGDVIVAGYTAAPDFPCGTSGCSNGGRVVNGRFDGFVARYDATLMRLLQVTFVGGSGSDQINALAIHPATGEVIVAGTTDSADLPCTTVRSGCADAAQPAAAGGTDGFVARLDPMLSRVLQVSYLGGSGGDEINAVAVNAATGEIIVAGSTSSANLPCVAPSDGCGPAPQPTLAGGVDGFVARFNPGLTTLLRTTYLGGTSVDEIWGVAVHPATGEIYVAGQTQSTDLPCTTSGVFCGPAAQPSLGGGVDGFIARFTPNLGRLLQTTYVGGPAADNVFALAIDPRSGDALVAGATGNATLACATQGGGCATGAQSSNPGGESGFVARFNASLTARIQATYLGGSAFDAIYALVVHPRTGEILVGGITASTDFPCTGGDRCAAGAQATSGGGQDGFVARLDAGLTRVLQATYMGGAGSDAIQTLAVHPQTGDVLVAGDTDSGNLACANRATCVQPPAGGGQDGFAARLSPDLSAADATPDPFDFAPDGNASPSTLRVSAPVRITGLSSAVPAYIEGTFGAAYCVSTAAGCACDVSGGFTTAPGSIANGQYVCVRHVAPPIPDATTRTVLHAGGAAAAFTSATGPLSTGCSLDVDGNGAVDALTDGLVLLRAMLGLTGTAATQDAIGPGATRTGWTAIRGYLNASCGTGFAG